MKNFALILISLLVAGHAWAEKRRCPQPWRGLEADCDIQQEIVDHGAVLTINFVRAGYLPENPGVSFKGNIIYYEGLGDSMVNHKPLFNLLTQAGYRVIAFDYLGQGGSGGTMDDTRIGGIAKLGDRIWDLYSRGGQKQKTIIGWSTGGLAAYLQAASDPSVDRVVLIAPGVVLKLFIGEQHPEKFEFNLITVATLTSQAYDKGAPNPHVEPVRPNSPILLPFFTANLLKESVTAQHTEVPARVRGFVLLSGGGDQYVDTAKNAVAINQKAPHFQTKKYPGALHEIDNEAEPNGSQSRQDILNFLNQGF